MQIIQLQQGSPEWLLYRTKHGMASETPSLLGSALFYPQTAFQLWLVKKGLADGHVHPGMRAGHEFEPFARERFMAEYDIPECEPCVVEEDTHLLAASLDGYCYYNVGEEVGGGLVLEIKHWTETRTMPATLADVWPAHYDQVQHQLAVTGAVEACLMYGNTERQTYLWVPPDEERETAIRAAWGKFWTYMEGEESPPLTERDYDEGICEEREFRDLEVSYAMIHAEYEAAEARLKQARAMLVSFADGRNVKGRHIQVYQGYRSSIDMAALRANVDVARYKRTPKLVTTVRKLV